MPNQIQFTDGRFYQCVTATSTGQSPTTHPAKWLEMRVPKEWRRVLAQLTYENLLKMGGQTDKAMLERAPGRDMLDDMVRLEANKEKWRERSSVG